MEAYIESSRDDHMDRRLIDDVTHNVLDALDFFVVGPKTIHNLRDLTCMETIGP